MKELWRAIAAEGLYTDLAEKMGDGLARGTFWQAMTGATFNFCPRCQERALRRADWHGFKGLGRAILDLVRVLCAQLWGLRVLVYPLRNLVWTVTFTALFTGFWVGVALLISLLPTHR